MARGVGGVAEERGPGWGAARATAALLLQPCRWALWWSRETATWSCAVLTSAEAPAGEGGARAPPSGRRRPRL